MMRQDDLGHKSIRTDVVRGEGGVWPRRRLRARGLWQQVVKSYEALPVDKGYAGEVRVKDQLHYSLRLRVDQTQALLQEVPRVYHTQINDILLAALAGALCGWSGRDRVVIGLEGHGREDIGEGIDTSRTVAGSQSLSCIASVSAGAAELIKSVKEQFALNTRQGLGYGVRSTHKEDTLQGAEPWIFRSITWAVDNVVRESRWLSGAGESQGEAEAGTGGK